MRGGARASRSESQDAALNYVSVKSTDENSGTTQIPRCNIAAAESFPEAAAVKDAWPGCPTAGLMQSKPAYTNNDSHPTDCTGCITYRNQYRPG